MNDVSDDALIGVVALKKYYTVFNGKRCGNAVEIRCIVSKNKRQGMGDKMINFITDICERDAKSGEYCYVFAQCVQHQFWNYRLDECNLARALILQVSMIDEYGRLWDNTTCRSTYTCKDKESPFDESNHGSSMVPLDFQD